MLKETEHWADFLIGLFEFVSMIIATIVISLIILIKIPFIRMFRKYNNKENKKNG